MHFKQNTSFSLSLTTVQAKIYKSTLETEKFLMSQTHTSMHVKFCLR